MKHLLSIRIWQRISAIALLFLVGGNASAHMAWLASNDQGHAVLWFGESLADKTYHMPEKVAGITLALEGSDRVIETEAVDTDDLVGIRSAQSVGRDGEVFGSVTYGLYHGMKLSYHVEHLPQRDASQWSADPRQKSPLQTIVKRLPDGGLMVNVLHNEKPAGGLSVKLYDSNGDQNGEAETDSTGMVSFPESELKPGLNAVLVGVTDNNASGTLDGEPYKSTADYLTSTFYITSASGRTMEKSDKKNPAPKVSEASGVSVISSDLPDLPEELTSFGAAIAGGKLFVYGGHTGEAHSYSVDAQSNRLWILDLSDSAAEWKKGASDLRLQGLALVPWGDRVVRIGGFSAMNEDGQEHDLRSQTAVAVYDPANDKWSPLAPLPEPRSSLDAAVLGDKAYVFGGWQLNGEGEDSGWHQSAWSLDLSDTSAEWQPLAEPPFQRRAISAAAHQGKLYVVGGMRPRGGPTTEVAVYDPESDSWKTGPSIPGSGMSGFGSSAFAVGGDLYVSAFDGFVHRLNKDGESWTTVAKSDPARFFHRMVPHNGNLLMIGGSNMEIGKFTHIDLIKTK